MAQPQKFVFMLKMDGCGHCTTTLENARSVIQEPGSKLRFFFATMDEYNQMTPFLNTTSARKVQEVEGFPTLFVVQNGNILKTIVGAQSVPALRRLLVD